MLLQLPSLWDFPQSHQALLQAWAQAGLLVPLVPMCWGFFVYFSAWLGPLAAPARRFFWGLLCGFFFFFPPSILLLLRYSQIKVLGYAFWSSAILYVEAFQGDVGESSQR